MKVKCINEESGLILNEIYKVVVIHSDGYELENNSNRHNPQNFEIIIEPEPDPLMGMTEEE